MKLFQVKASECSVAYEGTELVLVVNSKNAYEQVIDAMSESGEEAFVEIVGNNVDSTQTRTFLRAQLVIYVKGRWGI